MFLLCNVSTWIPDDMMLALYHGLYDACDHMTQEWRPLSGLAVGTLQSLLWLALHEDVMSCAGS